MKLLVFAHTPPPITAGATWCILMIAASAAIAAKKTGSPNPLGIECYHVNARSSETRRTVGARRDGIYPDAVCLQAIWCGSVTT